jgi:hypothetical protein
VDSVKEGYVVVYGHQEIVSGKVYTDKANANAECDIENDKGMSAWVMEVEIVD